MADRILIGQTDYSDLIFIPDPASTDGSGKTGLVAANLTVSYSRMETDNDATVTDVTSSLSDLAALTTAHTDWGIKEISSTLAPGLYRIDVADALFATGAWQAVLYVMITTSAAAATPKQYTLSTEDPFAGIAQTGDSFARIGAAGAGLTAIDLPDQTMNITGNITGNLSGSVGSVTGAVGSVTGAVGSVTGNVGGNVTGSIGSLANQAKLDVNAEADAAILDAALVAKLDTIDDFLDTEIASILAAVDTEVAAILAAVDTEVAAIKAKTDSLTFTVAGQVDANMQYINDTALIGNGGVTPWNHA
jgi:hypothetical protein